MFANLRNVKPNNIFETTIDQFGKELGTFLDRKTRTPVFQLKMQDDIASIKRQEPSLKPPFFTYRLSDVVINDEGVSPERLSRFGAYSGGPKTSLDDNGRPIDPNARYATHHMVPVNLTLNVEYHCTPKQQLYFSQEWLFLAVRRFQLFELEVDGQIYRIYADFDKSVTYSDIDYDNDNLVVCQTTAVMRTFMVKKTETAPMTTLTVSERFLQKDTPYPEGPPPQRPVERPSNRPSRPFDEDVFIVGDKSLTRKPRS